MTEHDPNMNVAPGQPHDSMLSETSATSSVSARLAAEGVSFWVASTSSFGARA